VASDAEAASGEHRSPTPSESPHNEDEGTIQAGTANRDPASSEVGMAQEDLLQALEKVTKDKQELYDQYLRLLADFDNFKKRITKEKAELIQFGNESLIKEFLPVIDNIERVLAHRVREEDMEVFRRGVELVLQEALRILARHDVRPIEAMGKPFNPNLHEAIQTIEDPEAQPETVVDEHQKGYTFRGKLLRPSMVIVAVMPRGEEGMGGGDPDDTPIIN